MGSFSYTCAFSHLPIPCGCPVKVFLITENKYGNRSGFSRPRWLIRTPPIDASYNDYGNIESIGEGFITKLWLRLLRKDIRHADKKTIQHSNDSSAIEEIGRMIHSGLLRVRSPGQTRTPGKKLLSRVSWAMIRTDVWNEAVEFSTFQYTDRDPELTSNSLKYVFAKEVEHQAKIKSIADSDEAFIKECYRRMERQEDLLHGYNIRDEPWLVGLESHFCEAAKMVHEDPALSPEIEDFLVRLQEVLYIQTFMDAARVGLQPPVSGPQDGEMKYHRKYASIISTITSRSRP